MQERDTYKFQKERLMRVTAENAPGKKVELDEASTMIKFRLTDPATGTILTEPSGEWFPSEFADKFSSDDALWNFIRSLSNGKL